MTDRLDEAGMPMLAQPCAALTAANAEREALEAIHEFLGIASKRLYPTPDKPNSDWAKLRSAVDALALLGTRAALTAGKVAEQEPTGFKTVPVKVTDAMIDAANAVPSGLAGSPPHWQWVWDALLSAAPQQPAPQQTAQEPVAWLHTTTNNSEREAFEAAMIRLSNMEESAHDKPYPGDDEANAFWAFWKDARAALAAEIVAGQESVAEAACVSPTVCPHAFFDDDERWNCAQCMSASQQSAEPKESDIGMVAVPKRAVDLLAQVRKDGIGHRASELQEVYRLLFAKGE